MIIMDKQQIAIAVVIAVIAAILLAAAYDIRNNLKEVRERSSGKVEMKINR